MSKSITPVEDQSVTGNQQEQLLRFVSDALNAAAKEGVGEILKSGILNRDGVQQVLGSKKKLRFAAIELVKSQLQQLAKTILRPLSSGEEIILDPTDGKETLAEARNLFNWIDADFKNYGTNVPAAPTGRMLTSVLEMAEDATFEQMFGSLPASLDDLCLTQAQIKQFVKNHRKWLRTDGYATFFLFKANGEHFVARVFLSSDGYL